MIPSHRIQIFGCCLAILVMTGACDKGVGATSPESPPATSNRLHEGTNLSKKRPPDLARRTAARKRSGIAAETPTWTYRTVTEYPHDARAFTQGLVYADGRLYESTGLYYVSSLREVALETGRVIQKISVDSSLFAEGLALWEGQLLQLTWKSGQGFVYDQATLELRETFTYSGQGWGLAYDGQYLLMSDGTSEIRRLDPTTRAEVSRFTVTDQGTPISNLNELEVVNGKLYANVWQTDRIAIIDPSSGAVEAWLDLTGLLPESETRPWTNVLNGIAYDPSGDRLLVTGKLWPKLYHIEVIIPTGEAK